MQCYADCKEGFRPSLTLIKQRTNIPENKVSTVRSRLVNDGFIDYDGKQGSIVIDWKRIWIYSRLDPSLTRKTPRKHPLPHATIRITPPPKPIGRLSEYWNLIPKIPMRQLTEEEEHFFKVLESMTPEEYEKMVAGITPADEKMGVDNYYSKDRHEAEREAVQPHGSIEYYPMDMSTATHEEDVPPTRLPF